MQDFLVYYFMKLHESGRNSSWEHEVLPGNSGGAEWIPP